MRLCAHIRERESSARLCPLRARARPTMKSHWSAIDMYISGAAAAARFLFRGRRLAVEGREKHACNYIDGVMVKGTSTGGCCVFLANGVLFYGPVARPLSLSLSLSLALIVRAHGTQPPSIYCIDINRSSGEEPFLSTYLFCHHVRALCTDLFRRLFSPLQRFRHFILLLYSTAITSS